jgi:hypothetical protein
MVAAGPTLDREQAGDRKRGPGPEPIEWSAERRLSWSDFLGRPDMMGDAGALTVYILSFSYGCDNGVFSYRVASMFQPAQSWVKPAVLMRAAESDRLLHHEQGHFSLSEVQARRFRRAVNALDQPCDAPEAEMKRLAAAQVRADFETQQRYDRDTAFGTNARRQGEWDGEIAKQLAALGAYVH